MTLRKRVVTPSLIAALTIGALMVAAPVFAAPHFVKGPDIKKNADFSLTATFKAAGLGNVVSEVFLTSSGGTAELQCVNPGGNNPPPKKVDFDDLQGQTVEITPKNGQITAKPTLGPPSLPGADEICPNKNWDVDIVSLTYENVELHIQQGGNDILTFDFGDVDP
jgi:hypothetical protein